MQNPFYTFARTAPRYTSYPTVPNWQTDVFTIEDYTSRLSQAFKLADNRMSLYLHLPFCESLCTYCACTTRITKNHNVESTYIEYLLREWNLYKETIDGTPILEELHIGGGTPTFFSARNLQLLFKRLFDDCIIPENHRFSFEGHPANTTTEHLQTLFELGFDRLSLGIQDFDPEVQRLIHRWQTPDQVADVVDQARDIGFRSINFDLVYGLPGQTLKSLANTFNHLSEMKPERLAFYQYAHVPKLKPAQKSFEAYLPALDSRWEMMEYGHNWLKDHGYEEVGMDHFALGTDELIRAKHIGKLHRNFMGYTDHHAPLLIGLGASAIGDCWSAYGQNEKSVEKYYNLLESKKLPVVRGHLLTEQEMVERQIITRLMCRFEADGLDELQAINEPLLAELEAENFIEWTAHRIKVKPAGRPLIRLICTAFDRALIERDQPAYMSAAI